MNKQEAIETLREMLKPGDTVYTVLRHVARSGMSRQIDCYVMEDNLPRWISRTVATACGFTFDQKREAIRVGGCGMDMGFHLVYSLSSVLFPDGQFVCIGKDCPANDHNNAYHAEKDGRCVVCGGKLPDNPLARVNGSRHYKVCSLACSTGAWKHSDGGYALRHKWM